MRVEALKLHWVQSLKVNLGMEYITEGNKQDQNDAKSTNEPSSSTKQIFIKQETMNRYFHKLIISY